MCHVAAGKARYYVTRGCSAAVCSISRPGAYCWSRKSRVVLCTEGAARAQWCVAEAGLCRRALEVVRDVVVPFLSQGVSLSHPDVAPERLLVALVRGAYAAGDGCSCSWQEAELPCTECLATWQPGLDWFKALPT